MKVTDEMVQVAVKKAVEAGLLPRHARGDDAGFYRELMELILQAAFELVPEEDEMMPSVFRVGADTEFHVAETPIAGRPRVNLHTFAVANCVDNRG